MRIKVFLFIFCLALQIDILFAQPSLQPKSFAESEELTLFTNYNTEQGLALNSIACGYRDKAGNLWFGTLGGGVSRYDGKSFTTFTTAQGLANNIVYSILEDKTGNFWFGTGGGGVTLYDGKSFSSFTTAEGLANNTVWSITEDKGGILWFGTSGGGVSRYDRKSFTNYTTSGGLANNTVKAIVEDKSGKLWFATDGGGLSRYDGRSFANFTVEHGLASNNVFTITEDKTGNLWFGTFGGGVSRYDGKSFVNFTTAQGLAKNTVYSIKEDKTGNLWFATDGNGISRYDGKSFTTFTSAHGLAHNTVWSITEDKTGHLWFGTFGGGVSRFIGQGVINFTTSHGLANNNVYSIMEDKSGNLWFGTLGGGASRFDGKTFTNFTTSQGLANNTIRCILEDRTGNIWFATDGDGVSRYDGKKFTNFTTSQGLADNIVWSIAEDKNGNLWFGTDGGGVSRYDGKAFTTFTIADGLANNNIWSILKDKSGNLWLATYGGGISRYDGKTFSNYTKAQGLASNDVWNITEDKFGNLWFGTSGGGVSRYDGKSFMNFTTADGLADDEVFDMVIDAQDNIFIGTNLGFSVLKKFKNTRTDPGVKEQKTKDGASAKASGKSTLEIPAVNALPNEELKNYLPVFEYYHKKTGYPIKELNINAIFCDSKGIIWAGSGDNKLIRFDYNAILKSTEPPGVYIQAVKLHEENISWYNLKNNGKVNPDSLTLLYDEVLTFGKTLSGAERDSLNNKFSRIRFDSIAPFYPIPQNLVLTYEHNNITFDFVAIEPARHFLVRYQYMLEGYDKDWSPVTEKTSANFGNMNEGEYTFKLKARSPDGIWSEPVTYKFKVLPPWYRTWWAYLLYAIFFTGLVWCIIHFRSRSLRREKRILEQKISQRTHQLSQSLQELKDTQSQLIQSEKMASLGELTAGIAHEIQNPLNFVNNFSEVSNELIDEMKLEIEKGAFDDAKAIAANVKQNLAKILYHGKRADAIVKSMLQHSRTSSGKKEPTDINMLADEYLRLAYHGLRAKDKSFSASIKTEFDNSIEKIWVMPQELARVLLNLFNNAFYAVSERRAQNQNGYQPAVFVSTKKLNGKVEIKVSDNGNGIPQKVLDKIFQPFFTTKPAGQGTGLGLSLTFDIVKAHSGEIKVNTKENEGTEFTITLPV